jgi:glycosyltransferase involved in cell wall biosynthesis
MQQADAFVMFSRYENLPCVLIEAMACGLPVISSNVGGIPEIVHDFNGRLVDSEDEEGLADRLKELIEENEHFDREKIRNFAVENFSMPSIGADLNQLYKSLS